MVTTTVCPCGKVVEDHGRFMITNILIKIPPAVPR